MFGQQLREVLGKGEGKLIASAFTSCYESDNRLLTVYDKDGEILAGRELLSVGQRLNHDHQTEPPSEQRRPATVRAFVMSRGDRQRVRELHAEGNGHNAIAKLHPGHVRGRDLRGLRRHPPRRRRGLDHHPPACDAVGQGAPADGRRRCTPSSAASGAAARVPKDVTG